MKRTKKGNAAKRAAAAALAAATLLGSTFGTAATASARVRTGSTGKDVEPANYTNATHSTVRVDMSDTEALKSSGQNVYLLQEVKPKLEMLAGSPFYSLEGPTTGYVRMDAQALKDLGLTYDGAEYQYSGDVARYTFEEQAVTADGRTVDVSYTLSDPLIRYGATSSSGEVKWDLTAYQDYYRFSRANATEGLVMATDSGVGTDDDVLMSHVLITIKMAYHDTGEEVANPNILYLARDLDVYNDAYNLWSEGLRFGDGWGGEIYVDADTRLRISSDGSKYDSCGKGSSLAEDEPEDEAAAIMTSGTAQVEWYGCFGGRTFLSNFFSPVGYLRVQKSSDDPCGLTAGNAAYSLEGAQYGVYASEEAARNDENRIYTLTTGADGLTEAVTLPAGVQYFVKETAAPSGYALSDEVIAVTVAAENGADAPKTLAASDKALGDPVKIEIKKVDAATGEASQGTATLAGTEFTVSYYGGYYDESSLPETPTRSWTLKANESGYAALGEQWLVSGDEFYMAENGECTMPCGTVKIEETAAPSGYVLPDGGDAYVFQIVADAEGNVTHTGSFKGTIERADTVISGGVRVKKTDDAGEPVEGAVFAVYNANGKAVNVGGTEYADGEAVATVTTGADGIAATAADALPVGSYRVKEISAPDGYMLNEEWEKEFTIAENGQTADFTDDPCVDAKLARGIEIVKTVEDYAADAKAGDVLTFGFTATNTGNVRLTGVSIVDEMEGLSEISYEWPGEEGVLEPGEAVTATATYALTQDDIENEEVHNSATAVGQPDVPNDPPITSPPFTVAPPLDPPAEITLDKAADKDVIEEAKPGDEIAYTFTVTNTGSKILYGVTIADDLEGLSEISYEWPREEGTLYPGESATAAAVYAVTQDDIDEGEVVNTATATGHDNKGREVSDKDDTETEIPGDPSIDLVKEADKEEAKGAGEEIAYTFTITNDGPKTLYDVTLADELEGLSEITVEWPGEAGTLLPGESATAHASYVTTQADADAGEVVNTASVTGRDKDGKEVSDEDDVKTTIPVEPEIELVKEVDKAEVRDAKAGEILTYTFTVTNTGNVTLTGVVISDALEGMSEIAYVWPAEEGTLLPGESATATATYAVTGADIAAGKVVNEATATGTASDGREVSDDDDATTTLVAPTPTPTPTQPVRVVQTGDNSNWTIYALIGAGAIIVAALILIKVGKK